MSQNTDALLEALARVEDPEGGSLVDRGRVSAPRLAGGIASLIVDATGLDAGAQADLERRIRAAASHVAGVSEVRIALTAAKVDRILIAIGSGKGGVGKSTVAANLAVALARTGMKVGLVDADIHGPSQPRIMGNADKPEAVGKQIMPVATWGVPMLSIGQLVAADTALAWRGPMVANALGQLLEADWGRTELLIVDLPPGTGDIQLSLLQKYKPSGAVIVSTPQDLALIDAARAIDLFRKLGVPMLGLIENMAGYACPHCGELSDPFGVGGAEAAAAAMAIPFLGRIPLKLSIRRASDAGTPPAAGEDEEAELFAKLAGRLLEQVNRREA